MYLMWSQMEEAWRDTLVHKSVGYSLYRTSNLYGLPWPEDEVPARGWRGALHVLGLGRRGTFWATFNAIEAALSAMNEAITVTIDPAHPYQLLRTDGEFTSAHVNRYIRTPFGLMFTTDLGVTEDLIKVCPSSTRYWQAPPYDVDTYSATGVPAEILPFMVYERSPGPIEGRDDLYTGDECLIEVVLLTGQAELQVPPTWLFEDTYGWEVTPPTLLPGTVLSLNEAHGLTAGDAVFFPIETGVVPPAPFVAGTTYYVLAPTGSDLSLEATIGGGAITFVDDGTGTSHLTIAVDVGRELGGNILADENTLGSQSVGPYPVYLYDGTAYPQLTAVLQRTVPAGVILRVTWDVRP